MHDFIFKDPFWLAALVVLPLLVWARGRRGLSALVVPFAAAWRRPHAASGAPWPALLAGLGLVLLTLALARPQHVEDRHQEHRQGYDIMLAIDLSGSMLTEDYQRDGQRINRLQALKPVIQAFINQRPNDRIGVVVFAKGAYTLSPLTFDHDWLSRQTDRLRIGLIDGDATAIGDGLGVALSRLEQAGRETANRRQGAFIILLTDGANNSGTLTPPQATAIAKARGIPVYTIGAGQDGFVPFPIMDDAGHRLGYRQVLSDLDENALRDIAAATGGRYFRAADTRTIADAFKAIDRAQKIEFDAKSTLITRELFPWFAVPGIAALLLAALLVRPPWRREALA